MERITKSKLYEWGFSSYFTTDPQELNASICHEKGGIKIHQPNEYVEEFIMEVNGEYIEIVYFDTTVLNHSINNT